MKQSISVAFSPLFDLRNFFPSSCRRAPPCLILVFIPSTSRLEERERESNVSVCSSLVRCLHWNKVQDWVIKALLWVVPTWPASAQLSTLDYFIRDHVAAVSKIQFNRTSFFFFIFSLNANVWAVSSGKRTDQYWYKSPNRSAQKKNIHQLSSSCWLDSFFFSIWLLGGYSRRRQWPEQKKNV